MCGCFLKLAVAFFVVFVEYLGSFTVNYRWQIHLIVLLHPTTDSNLPTNHVNLNATVHLTFFSTKRLLNEKQKTNEETKVAGYTTNIKITELAMI